MKKILEVVKFFLFLSLAIVLLFFAFKDMAFSALWESLKNANYLWVLPSLVFAFLAYISRAIRWKMLIEPLGYQISSKKTFYALMIGYTANFAFPRIGEITRCATLTKTDKIPMDKLIGTVILERICDFIVLIFLLVFLFLFKINFFGKFLNEHIFLPFKDKFSSIFNISTLKLLLICLVFIIFLICLYFLRNKFKSNKLFIKGFEFFKGILSGLITIIHMKKLGGFLFHTVVIWVMYFFMTYTIFFALSSTSNLAPIDGLFILVVGGLGMSAPVQGGIGAYHLIVSLGLTLYGITDGLVFATLAHSTQSLFAILLGTISMIAVFLINKKNKTVSSQTLP